MTPADILANYEAWRKEPARASEFDAECEREFARRYVAARLEEREAERERRRMRTGEA